MSLNLSLNSTSLSSIISAIRAKFDGTIYPTVEAVEAYVESLGIVGDIVTDETGAMYLSSNGRYLLIFK